MLKKTPEKTPAEIAKKVKSSVNLVYQCRKQLSGGPASNGQALAVAKPAHPFSLLRDKLNHIAEEFGLEELHYTKRSNELNILVWNKVR